MSLKVPKAGGPELFKAGYKVSATPISADFHGLVMSRISVTRDADTEMYLFYSICLVWRKRF